MWLSPGLKDMSRPKSVDMEDVPESVSNEVREIKTLRDIFELEQLSVSVITYHPGQLGEPHFHDPPLEEIYFVLDGRIDIRIGEDTIAADAGTVCHIPPGAVHQPQNNYDEPCSFIAMYAPLEAWNRTAVSSDE